MRFWKARRRIDLASPLCVCLRSVTGASLADEIRMNECFSVLTFDTVHPYSPWPASHQERRSESQRRPISQSRYKPAFKRVFGTRVLVARAWCAQCSVTGCGSPRKVALARKNLHAKISCAFSIIFRWNRETFHLPGRHLGCKRFAEIVARVVRSAARGIAARSVVYPATTP